jgi:hypothetical protein
MSAMAARAWLNSHPNALRGLLTGLLVLQAAVGGALAGCGGAGCGGP